MFFARVLSATTFYNNEGLNQLFEKTYILQIGNHIKGKGKE